MSTALANQLIRLVLLVVLLFLVRDFWRARNGAVTARLRDYFGVIALNMIIVILGVFESVYDVVGADLNTLIRDHVYVLNGLHALAAIRLWQSLEPGR